MEIQKKISVAIPTYYSSDYISQCIKSLINIPIISEVIINDDNSSKQEYEKLNKKIIKLNKKVTFDISISRNSNNLGGFKNKYIVVEKCKNDIVYQIDSDNFLHKNSLGFFKNFQFNFQDNHILFPGKILTYAIKKKGLFKKEIFDKTIISSSNQELNLKNVKTYLNMENESPIPENKSFGIKWFLNLGNPVFYKKNYLNNLNEGFKSNNLPLQACSIALTYFWLKNNGTLKILEDMSHIHRLHSESYFIREGDNARKSVDYFVSKINNL